MKVLLIALAVVLWPFTATAQHTPYAGQHVRAIKALSNDEVQQYHAGAGMGFARAAELNSYPGPMHVLELTEQLALSSAQHEATKRLMESHKAEAKRIGEKLVEAERALDQLFAGGKFDAAQLAQQVKQAAAIQGEYRLAHLDTHRQMRAILTSQQVARYDALRGYAGHSH